jgi:polyisoprenoid-binding protein YceI
LREQLPQETFHLNKIIQTTLALLAISTAASASSKQFQVVGEKLSYRNMATVESESDFETFTGKTNAVSGSINFDPATKTGSGTVVIDVAAIDTGIPLRNDHMKSAGWMDAAKYPTIKFETGKVQKLSGDNYKITGKLTLHGVTREVTTTARVRYRAAGEATKAVGFDGDVLQISSKFVIKLSDFGINVPANLKTKVSNQVTLSVSAYATAK